MSHRKTDLGIPDRAKSAKVVLGRVLINQRRSISTAHVRYSSNSSKKAEIDLGPLGAISGGEHSQQANLPGSIDATAAKALSVVVAIFTGAEYAADGPWRAKGQHAPQVARQASNVCVSRVAADVDLGCRRLMTLHGKKWASRDPLSV
jgi:hypothetical protein